MPAEFDAYYKWLGIPPKDQPPHHYRLLGIEKFEPDLEVIDAAANRVMGYLQNLSVGDQAEASQQLLNEIATARLCLLDPSKKAEYDEGLRRTSSAAKAAPPVRRPRPDVTATSDSVAVPMAESTAIATAPLPPKVPSARVQQNPAQAAPVSKQVDARRERKKRNHTVTVAVLAIAFVAIAGTTYYMLNDSGKSGGSKNRRERSSKSNNDKSKDKSSNSKKPRKSEKQLPPLAKFDINKKPVEPINEKPPEEVAKWLEQADKAIREGRVAQAAGLLRRYLQYPNVPLRREAMQWLVECEAAQISEAQAADLISQLNGQQLAALKRGQLTLRIEDLEFTRPPLEEAFYRRLRNHAAKRK